MPTASPAHSSLGPAHVLHCPSHASELPSDFQLHPEQDPSSPTSSVRRTSAAKRSRLSSASHSPLSTALLLLLCVSQALASVYDAGAALSAADFSYAKHLSRHETDEVTFLSESDFALGRELGDADLFSSQRIDLGSQRDKFHGDYAGRAPLLAKQGQRRNRMRKGVRYNGVRLETDKWPGAQIPYVISSRYNQRERAILARAIQAYHDSTCVRFVPRSGQRDYIYIGKIDGCFSDVGRAGSRQEVSLDDGCVEFDTAIHELMHAVGFWHEHERWDRDQYIDVVWRNIDRDAYDQFGRVNLFESSYYGETYDYYSIMHYDRRSFSKNGRDTMVAKQAGMTRVIGRVKNFSPADLRKINKVYQCSKRPARPVAAFTATTRRPYWRTTPRPTAFPIASRVGSTTSSGTCVDKATLCWRWVPRCRSPFFEQIMRQFCAASCGFCSPAAARSPQLPSHQFQQNAAPRTSFNQQSLPRAHSFNNNYRVHG